MATSYEDDVKAVAAHASSLAKVQRKLHALLADKCPGLKDDAARAASQAALEAASTELGAACDVELQRAEGGQPTEELAGLALT